MIAKVPKFHVSRRPRRSTLYATYGSVASILTDPPTSSPGALQATEQDKIVELVMIAEVEGCYIKVSRLTPRRPRLYSNTHRHLASRRFSQILPSFHLVMFLSNFGLLIVLIADLSRLPKIHLNVKVAPECIAWQCHLFCLALPEQCKKLFDNKDYSWLMQFRVSTFFLSR